MPQEQVGMSLLVRQLDWGPATLLICQPLPLLISRGGVWPVWATYSARPPSAISWSGAISSLLFVEKSFPPLLGPAGWTNDVRRPRLVSASEPPRNDQGNRIAGEGARVPRRTDRRDGACRRVSVHKGGEENPPSGRAHLWSSRLSIRTHSPLLSAADSRLVLLSSPDHRRKHRTRTIMSYQGNDVSAFLPRTYRAYGTEELTVDSPDSPTETTATAT
ncbi:hypothetical protein VTK73DRAFT_3840 [Phialemonium thermophilum]|uniref:Uncharacterized protein n=1 Tax=Phialemonium thermophilum TaxID=223376 RepID=A0ABR3VE41_9PEZI